MHGDVGGDGEGQEVEELRASRERLVKASAAESRAIERALHDGLQQQLVALAVELQHASTLVDRDIGATKTLLDKMSSDVEVALDEAGRLAERIHAPLLEQEGRLAAALRAAAVTAGGPAPIQGTARPGYPPANPPPPFLSSLLAPPDADERPAITVTDEGDVIVFEIVSSTALERLRDRVEALGGRLVAVPADARAVRVSGSLPLPRRA